MDVRTPLDSNSPAGPSAPFKPADEFQVADGQLVWHPRRDVRFPALYEVDSHPLVPRPSLLVHVFVFMQDVSKDAMEEKRAFEDGLEVPLGPDALVAEQGYIQIPDRSIVFAREKGPKSSQDPTKDSVYAYVINAKWTVAGDDIQELKEIRDQILGPSEDVGNQAPVLGSDGVATGGTAFERNHIEGGFTGVNGTRCYSLTITHQRPPNKLAPTCSIKIANGRLTEAQKARKRLIKAKTALTSKIIKSCAPQEFIEVMEQHAEWDNIPIVGDPENRFTPALQANFATAVSYDEATKTGLSDMGNFGQVQGHIDKDDSPAGLTSMVVSSQIPETYEGGRFHLLSLGVYVSLEYLAVLAFSGLNKHGGTPPIAPPGEEVDPSAVRFITVCYPPESMLNGAGDVQLNIASYGKKILSMTPEVSCNLLLENPTCSNEANIANEGPGFMEPYPLVEFLARSLLQVSTHVMGQVFEEYDVRIDSTKFLDAFSLRESDDQTRTAVKPWIGAAQMFDSNSTALISHPGANELQPQTAVSGTSSSPLESCGTPSYNNACKAHYLKWIDHCERQAKFIPSTIDCDWEAFRERIRNGDFSRRAFPRGRLKPPGNSGKRKHDNNQEGSNPAPNKKQKKSKEQQDPTLNHTDNVPAFIGGSSGIANFMSTADDMTAVIESLDSNAIESEDDTAGPPSSTALDAALKVSSIPEVDLDSESELELTESTSPAVKVSSNSLQQAFLASLSAQEIEAATSDFCHAINSLTQITSYNGLGDATRICQTTLLAISQSPCDRSTATALQSASIWGNLSRLEDFATAQGVDLRMTRALIILSEWSLFSWVDKIVQSALKSTSHTRTTWVDCLVDDIKSAVLDDSTTAQRSPVYTFAAETYLPSGNYPKPQKYRCLRRRKKWSYNDEDHIAESLRLATSTIRHWLQFPDTPLHAARYTFVDILLSTNVPKCILYLDPVWNVFRNPAHYLLRADGQKRTRKLPQPSVLVQQRLEPFRELYSSHSICQANDAERLLLDELLVLSTRFEDLLRHPGDNSTPASSIPATLAGDLQEPLESTAPSSSTTVTTAPSTVINNVNVGHDRFSQYIRALLPLLKSLSLPPKSSKLLIKVAKKPDHFMPFRQKAPTMQAANRLIYASRDQILTHAGIFNILAFRGVFYGAPYARSTSLQFFNSLEEWLTVYNRTKLERPNTPEDDAHERASKKRKGPAEKWFCNLSAYGSSNPHRTTELLPSYWQASPLFLQFLLQDRQTVPTVYKFLAQSSFAQVQSSLFPDLEASSLPSNSSSHAAVVLPSTLARYFPNGVNKSAFPNIGPLTAFLICGDLVGAGILPAPSAFEVGLLLAKIDKGAVEGLESLGLISSHSPPDLTAQAFENLHDFVLQTFTEDEVLDMGYSALMLEHALCKLTRVSRLLPWK